MSIESIPPPLTRPMSEAFREYLIALTHQPKENTSA